VPLCFGREVESLDERHDEAGRLLVPEVADVLFDAGMIQASENSSLDLETRCVPDVEEPLHGDQLTGLTVARSVDRTHGAL